MHLGNGLICPMTGFAAIAAVGISFPAAFFGAKKELTKEKALRAALLGVFVFALQMINFSIPQTGSSGHIIGAILLAALAGPSVAFLAMCLILAVQALFFADGGLLAYGCNVINMGLLPCFVVYPLVFKPFEKRGMAPLGAFLASILALQTGSLAAAVEISLSGSIAFNIALFIGLMQSIHLAIGFVEGLFTASVVGIAQKYGSSKAFNLSIGALGLILASTVANFASKLPDGLEWALIKMDNAVVTQAGGRIYAILDTIQARADILNSMPQIYANLLGALILASVTYLILSKTPFKNLKDEN